MTLMTLNETTLSYNFPLRTPFDDNQNLFFGRLPKIPLQHTLMHK